MNTKFVTVESCVKYELKVHSQEKERTLNLKYKIN